MKDKTHVLAQTFLNFQSQDRDQKVWPETNKYQIDIPKFNGVTTIKLASFEMPSMPKYTIESEKNDTLHLHEGCIIGCAKDFSANLDINSSSLFLYENQLLLAYYEDNVYFEKIISVPSYDNTCKIDFNSSPSDGSVVRVTVTSVAPHGLHSAYSGVVWLINGPFENQMISDEAGLRSDVTIIDTNSFSVDVISLTSSSNSTICTMHAKEPSFQELAEQITNYCRHLNTNLVCLFKNGVFNFKYVSINPASKVCLYYSYNRADTSGNPRGLGFSIGSPRNLFTNTNGINWTCESNTPETTEIKFPAGIIDISTMGNLLGERLNSLNLSYSVPHGSNALHMGVTDYLGSTHAIYIPVGKYSVVSFKSYLEAELASKCGGSWTLTYSDRTWVIDSTADFCLHFSTSAESNSLWSKQSASPSAANSVNILARYLGFVPNCSYYSKNKSLTSVEKSSLAVLMKYPRRSKINDNTVVSMIQNENAQSRRNLQNTYIIGSRDPPTRKIGFGCRRNQTLSCSVTASSLYTGSGTDSLSNADTGAVYYLTVQPSSSYNVTPPLFFDVGSFVNISNATRSASVTGQVVSLGTDAMTATIVLQKDLAVKCFNDLESASYPINVNIFPFHVPRFSLLGSNRKNTIKQRIGLLEDVDISDFQDLSGTWNVDHEPAILLRINAIGAVPNAQATSLIQSSNVVSSCLARISVRSSGVTHVNSMGSQELNFSSQNISKLQVELLNNDGTPYESHKLNHNISLIIQYNQ